MARDDLIQIRILQISDIHFGADHICAPPHADRGRRGFPSLAQLVIDDLNGEYWNSHPWANGQLDGFYAPLLMAATGDFTQIASMQEFDSAREFLNVIASSEIMGRRAGIDNLFMVPGNHDVIYTEANVEHRFVNFSTFYNMIYADPQQRGRRPIARANAIEELTLVHKLDAARTIIAEINCCQYVQINTVDQSRGQVDAECIANIRRQLDALDQKQASWIKIALLHHHPILIPNFIEPGRNVDSIANADSLLRLLREHEFHVILHGHKHYPHVFTYDPEPAWTDPSTAQLIVAGGSLGSRGLPAGTASMNTYNLMTVKWDPQSRIARAEVVTRGLRRVGRNGDLDPDQWRWETLKVYNRVLSNFEHIPKPAQAKVEPFPDPPDAPELARSEVYKAQRGNMPVVEVFPSLLPGQGYEARVWLVQHSKHGSPPAEIPVRVTWSGGRWFSRKVVEQDGKPHFAVSFNYWGSTIVQAIMEFSDGSSVAAHVYARVPTL